MWIMFTFFALVAAMVQFSGTTDYLEREKSTITRQSKVAADNFRMFAWAAWVYVQENPTASGSIPWATIKTATKLPDAVKAAGLNPNWKIIADGAGKWTICAEIPSAAAGALGNVVSDKAKRHIVNGNLVFSNTAAEAATEEAKCL